MVSHGLMFPWILALTTLCISVPRNLFSDRAEPQAVSVVTDANPGAPARHGSEKLLAALRRAGIPVEQTASLDRAHGKLLIVTGLAEGNGPAARLLKAENGSLPQGPEALTIHNSSYRGKRAWIVAGSDDRGVMYGELDTADRVGWSRRSEEPLGAVRETTERPDVTTRAVSLYTMNRVYWESRFYDEKYWERYLDTLAQNRFNSIVLIFGYENGGFLAPCYPYFFDVEGFQDVRMAGIRPEEQKRNLAALNRLIRMAHDRGLQFTVGIWDHIYRGGVQGGGVPGADEAAQQPTQGLVWGLTGDNLIPYTRAALAKFIREVPDLDGIQFRMHDESGLKPGEQEGFWRDVFQMVKQESPNLRLDLRAKGLPDAVIQDAIKTGVKFRITTKYWMEQMGLPFHPTHVNPQDQHNRRHGYADLLRYPQEYRILWRLWNGGTARILLWGDPDYAKRFVESTHLYEGDGFEINEPLATKMEGQPHDAKPFDLLDPPYRYYDYEFERYWHTFQVFGRIGYNPNTPHEVWDREFERRFGKSAAPDVERALHLASRILPRIVASSYPYSAFPMTVGWAEKQCFGDLPTFARAQGSDVQQFESFDEEAQRLIEGGETAKVRPQETSRWFAETAKTVLSLVDEAEKNIGRDRNKEFDSTMVDLKILAGLARYHAQRIPAAVNYRLFVHTRDVRALDEALKYERLAEAAWHEIVNAAGDVYASDLKMGARSRNLCGHWKDELRVLDGSRIALEREREAASAKAALLPAPHATAATVADADLPVVTHTPIATAPASQPLTIDAEVKARSGVKWVRLRYRSVTQYEDYRTLPMLPTGVPGRFQATVPADQIPSRFDFMYFFEVMDNAGHGRIYPDLNQTTPYFIVRLSR